MKKKSNKIGRSSNQKSNSNAASINTRSSQKNNESRSVENIQGENQPITRSRSTRRQKRQEIPERLSSDEESDIKRTKRQIVNANTENKVENSSYQKSIKNTTSIKTRSMRKNNESAAEENIQDENLPITRSSLTQRPQQTENAESLSSDEESDIKIPIRKNVNENTANKIGSSSNKKSKSNAALINTRSKGKNIELATVDDIQEENLPITSSRSTRRQKHQEIPERLSSDEESDIKIPKRQRVNENTANKIGSKNLMNRSTNTIQCLLQMLTRLVHSLTKNCCGNGQGMSSQL